MSDKQICHLILVPYVATIGAISYFVSPWVLLVFLGGYRCDNKSN